MIRGPSSQDAWTEVMAGFLEQRVADYALQCLSCALFLLFVSRDALDNFVSL